MPQQYWPHQPSNPPPSRNDNDGLSSHVCKFIYFFTRFFVFSTLECVFWVIGGRGIRKSGIRERREKKECFMSFFFSSSTLFHSRLFWFLCANERTPGVGEVAESGNIVHPQFDSPSSRTDNLSDRIHPLWQSRLFGCACSPHKRRHNMLPIEAVSILSARRKVLCAMPSIVALHPPFMDKCRSGWLFFSSWSSPFAKNVY